MTTRLSVNIADGTAAALQALSDKHGTSLTETVRRAVSVYAGVAEQWDEHRKVLVRDGDVLYELTFEEGEMAATAVEKRRMLPTTRFLDLDALHLAAGSHRPNGEMCVMEAVAYIAGEEWSDCPKCASPVIGEFLRAWNDAMSDGDRQMLKPLIPRLVNTAASRDVELERSWLAFDWFCRVGTPRWLRAAGLEMAATAVENTSAIVGSPSAAAAQAVLDDARRQARAAWAAARDAAPADASAAAAQDAVRAAAWDAARDAARDAAATNSGAVAAWVAAWDAGWDAALAAGYAAETALRLAVDDLQSSALELVERMIECGRAA